MKISMLAQIPVFAQANQDAPAIELPPNYPQQYPPEYGESLLSPWFGAFSSLLSFVYFAFIIWMLIECVRKDPDRYLWIWVILIFQPIGAVIYFFARWLPSNQIKLPKALRNLTRGSEITKLEAAAQQIGNAHQFIELGDVLREIGQLGKAGKAYARALEKDASNLQALWGATQIDMQQKQFSVAEQRLEKILSIDGEYKFGDVSLTYGKVLMELGKNDLAEPHLLQHIRRWRHPESLYLLAKIRAHASDNESARDHLQAMLMDINGSPKAIARRNVMWKSRARRMLRRLPRGSAKTE